MFFAINEKLAKPQKTSPIVTIAKDISRLMFDHIVTIFFQEWAPLFPVLHQPSFLNLYNKYIDNPDSLTSHESIALLNLVFSIGTLSTEVKHK